MLCTPETAVTELTETSQLILSSLKQVYPQGVFMSDINPADYNNGVPPEPGVVWNGDTWAWPTRGYNVPPLPGDTETLTVTPKGTPADTWPERPDIKEWYVPGEKPFDPSTGNGWVPDEDGYGEVLPAGIPAVVQAAINKVKGAPLKGGMSAVATVATVLTLVRAALDIPAAGEGSDRVPGRNIDMLAAQASLYTAMKTNIQPGMKTVDLPVRGYISYDGNGRQSVNLVRTGTGGISATVPVLSAVRDKITGLDKITVPAVAGAPSRTILINPVPVGPAAPSHTGSSTPVPVTPVHTGTDVKQADSIVTSTLPAADIPALQDFIYWQPDATGTGVEPIYVMLSDPLDSGKYTRRQLQKKYKHAVDFGISDTKINSETLTKFRDAIEAHLADKDTVEKGTYRRDKGSKVYFNPKTMRAVIIRANGDFLSGWKIDPNEENGKIYLNTGIL